MGRGASRPTYLVAEVDGETAGVLELRIRIHLTRVQRRSTAPACDLDAQRSRPLLRSGAFNFSWRRFEMAEQTSENKHLAGQKAGERTPAERTLDDICAATLKRRGRRGRPEGTGRKHPEKCSPKTFRNFSPLAHCLLVGIRLTGPDLMQQTEADRRGSSGPDGAIPVEPESASGPAARLAKSGR
jgi:hypothetical protein